MNFEPTPRAQALQSQLAAFMDAHIYPAEPRFHDEVHHKQIVRLELALWAT